MGRHSRLIPRPNAEDAYTSAEVKSYPALRHPVTGEAYQDGYYTADFGTPESPCVLSTPCFPVEEGDTETLAEAYHVARALGEQGEAVDALNEILHVLSGYLGRNL